jgi:hypothetical protein
VRTRAGYLLRIDRDDLDVLVFQRLVDEASVAQRAGDTAAADAGYGQALRLWRGEPLRRHRTIGDAARVRSV